VRIALLALALVACDSRPVPGTEQALPGYSNIYGADYVGPARCGECHSENFASWRDSLHAKMNQRADGIWPEAAGTVAYAGGTMTFAGGVMTTVSARGEARSFRVTRTIGSRYLQEYVGVQATGPEPAGHAIYRTELRLPFGSWRRAGGWMPRSYFDSWYAAEYDATGALAMDAYRPDDEPWATRCAWCHNTYPFELRALRADDAELGHGLEQFVDVTVARRSPAGRAAIAATNLLPVDELVTVGISCESCHLGGREHADHEADISFVPRSPDLRVAVEGGRDSPVVVDAICAGCHSTPSPRWPNQAAQRNSTEALDLRAGACTPAIACTDCHDPHVAGPGPGAPDQPRHIAACVGCHAGQAGRDHARHDGVSCLDCHMPRIVQGLSAMVRSHRISSPSADAMLTLDTPNACNLCHLDRSLTWTIEQLDEGWGRWPGTAEDPGGDAGEELGLRWLRAPGALRLTAAAAYARSPLGRAALPAMLERLDDPVAYDRMWMQFAIEDVLGRALTRAEYDPTAPPATRTEQAAKLRAVLPTTR